MVRRLLSFPTLFESRSLERRDDSRMKTNLRKEGMPGNGLSFKGSKGLQEGETNPPDMLQRQQPQSHQVNLRQLRSYLMTHEGFFHATEAATSVGTQG